MKRRISDLLDEYLDDTVEMAGDSPLSSNRIKELTLNRVQGKAVPARRKGRIIPKIIAIAAAISMLSITGYAVTKGFGLLEHFGNYGFGGSQEVHEMVETFPNEAATLPETVSKGEIKAPEYRLTEALCDDHSLYVVTEIKPTDDRYLLVPSELDAKQDVEEMKIPGISGMSIREYAASLGKEVLYVGTHLSNDNEHGVSAGWLSECSEDGTVYQYFAGENMSDSTEFPLTVTCVYYTLDMPQAEQFAFDVQITNNSQDKTVTTFTQFEDPGMGLTIHSLTLEETELGIYAEFRFSFTEGEGFGFFNLRDANGEYLPFLALSGNPMYEDNGDGTYTSKSAYKKMDSIDGLTYRVARVEDFEYFGPFKILG